MPGSTFPAALDSFPAIDPNTAENAAGLEHDVVHNLELAALASLQVKVGIDGSADPTSLDKRVADLEAVGVGADGRSAYEVAVDNGFVGTEVEWLASLVGAAGADGAAGATGATGAAGAAGAAGADGKSAYEVAVDNGFVGTEPEWLASLAATAGSDGVPYEIAAGDSFTVAAGRQALFSMPIDLIGDDSTIDVSGYLIEVS